MVKSTTRSLDLNHWLSPVLYVCYGRLLSASFLMLSMRGVQRSVWVSASSLLLHGQHVWQDVGQHLQQGWALLPRALLPLLGSSLSPPSSRTISHGSCMIQTAPTTGKKSCFIGQQRLGLKTEKLTYFDSFPFLTECFCISASQLTLFSLHLKHADSLPRQKLHSIDPTGVQSGLLVSKHVHAD